jgi:hypothetical protein
MLHTIKKACLHSLTIAWGYCLAAAGAALQAFDYLVDPLGDPEFRSQVALAVGDPRTAGRILLGISVITILVRLRSLRKVG